MAGWFGSGGRRRAASLPDGPLRRYLETPTPSGRTPVAELSLLAVDMETTGLDPRNDAILSIGWVPIEGADIVLGRAGHVLVSGEQLGREGVGQSATIHGLTDDRLAAGVPLTDAIERLLEALTGRVLVAHHAALETGFLAAACQRLWGVRPDVAAIDTMLLQQRIVAPGFDDEPRRDELRLWNARARFGLPIIGAHDAVHDALSAAELYLAQVAELDLGGESLRSVRS